VESAVLSRLAIVVAVAATILAACTAEMQPSPTPDEVIPSPDEINARAGRREIKVVTIYRGSNWDGVHEFRSECPRGITRVSGGGADKFSGKGHFNILERGHRYRKHGLVGWVEEIEVGPGPLRIHVTAHCVRR
jgi:hypothetical protein